MILKVTVILLFALVASASLRRAAAATRHAVLAAGQIAALALPLLAFVVPPFTIAYEAPTLRLPQAAAPASSVPLAGVPAPRPYINYVDSLSEYLTWVWLAGFLAIASARMVSYARARAVVARSAPCGDVLLSDEIGQPSTSFSSIVLPAEALRWDGERLRAVLLHERAHVTRHDTGFEILSDAVCAVYWFHPLAWLAARRARLERERACDDAVLQHGIAPVDYAAALLDVARSLRGQVTFGSAMAERTHLEQRVRSILDVSLPRRATRTARAFAFVWMLASAPLLAALTTLAISRPQSGEPDLRGDAVASPFSEYIGVDAVDVVDGVDAADAQDPAAAGPDAALIERMRELARREPQSPIDFVADRARWALGRARSGRLVEPLIDSVHGSDGDSDWRIRAYAAWALGYSTDPRSIAPLAILLTDEVWRVRAAAAHALRNRADRGAAAEMQRALSDDAWQVRSQAVHYFATIGAGRELFHTMRKDRHVVVRDAAEEALR